MLLIFPCEKKKKNNSLVKLLNFTPVASRTPREYNYVKEPLNGCFFVVALGTCLTDPFTIPSLSAHLTPGRASFLLLGEASSPAQMIYSTNGNTMFI